MDALDALDTDMAKQDRANACPSQLLIKLIS